MINVVIKTLWYCHKCRYEAMEHNETHIYGLIIFNKGAITIQWGKKISSTVTPG